MRVLPSLVAVLLLLLSFATAPDVVAAEAPSALAPHLVGKTRANTPAAWWTSRDDTPWAGVDTLEGEQRLTAAATLPNGVVVEAGTYCRWRRLLPGYDINPANIYDEARDEHYQTAHPGGTTHTYSGAGPFGENKLTIGSIGQPTNLNPILQMDSASGDITYFIYARLLDIDDRWQPIPQLAEGYTISPDGREYTCYIRPGVTFSDGTPLNAVDVAFTYDSILDANVNSPRKGDFADLDEVEVIDGLTVSFHLTSPYAPFDKQLTYGILPSAQFELPENTDMNAAEFNAFPIGAGPYVLGPDGMTDENTVLLRNPKWFGRPAPIEKIVFQRTSNQQGEQAALEAHAIDVGSVMIAELDRVADAHPEIHQLRSALTLGYSYLGLNHKSEFFSDLRVRQAFAHAINRDRLIEQIVFGHGEIAHANIPPMSPYYNSDVPTYDYNPTEAKRLLAAAGWADANGDGVVDKAGRPFRITLITNAGNPYRKKTAELMQLDLKVVGVEASIEIIEWSSFINDYIHEHKFDAFILAWTLLTDPDDLTIFDSTQFDDGLNYGYYSNPVADDLLRRGRRETDFERRHAIYIELQSVIATDLPYIFLFHNKKSGGVLKRVQGLPQVEPSDTTYLVPPHAAYTWWIKGYEPADLVELGLE